MFERFDIDFVSRFPHVHDPDGFRGVNGSYHHDGCPVFRLCDVALAMSFTFL